MVFQYLLLNLMNLLYFNDDYDFEVKVLFD